MTTRTEENGRATSNRRIRPPTATGTADPRLLATAARLLRDAARGIADTTPGFSFDDSGISSTSHEVGGHGTRSGITATLDGRIHAILVDSDGLAVDVAQRPDARWAGLACAHGPRLASRLDALADQLARAVRPDRRLTAASAAWDDCVAVLSAWTAANGPCSIEAVAPGPWGRAAVAVSGGRRSGPEGVAEVAALGRWLDANARPLLHASSPAGRIEIGPARWAEHSSRLAVPVVDAMRAAARAPELFR